MRAVVSYIKTRSLDLWASFSLPDSSGSLESSSTGAGEWQSPLPPVGSFALSAYLGVSEGKEANCGPPAPHQSVEYLSRGSETGVCQSCPRCFLLKKR